MGLLCTQENLDLFWDGANMQAEEEAKPHSTVKSEESKSLVTSFGLLDQHLNLNLFLDAFVT